MGEILEKVNGLRKPFAFFIDDQVSFSSWPIENYNNRVQVPSSAARFSGGVAVTVDDWYPSIKEGGKISASVIKIYGESSARVQFEVEYTYVPCEGVGNGGSVASYNRVNASPVMSLRWHVQDNIDGNTWLQTRTFNGKIELLNRNINPHFARYVVMPPLTKGYKRQSINYSESEDGRSLSFSIVDKEMFIQAPFPVTNFNGIQFKWNTAGSHWSDSAIRINSKTAVSLICYDWASGKLYTQNTVDMYYSGRSPITDGSNANVSNNGCAFILSDSDASWIRANRIYLVGFMIQFYQKSEGGSSRDRYFNIWDLQVVYSDLGVGGSGKNYRMIMPDRQQYGIRNHGETVTRRPVKIYHT